MDNQIRTKGERVRISFNEAACILSDENTNGFTNIGAIGIDVARDSYQMLPRRILQPWLGRKAQ